MLRAAALPAQVRPPGLGALSARRHCSLPCMRLRRSMVASPCRISSETDAILQKYCINLQGGDAEPAQKPVVPGGATKASMSSASGAARAPGGMGTGVFTLLLLNFGLYAAAALMHFPLVTTLALQHWNPQWWQFLSASFLHADWQHLSSNAFSLLIFGRIGGDVAGQDARAYQCL